MADLLGPLPDNLVRVGYISTTRGYVSGLTICDANDYVNLNPGTTFIFEDGDNNVNYLNIEQVNLLTNEDVLRKDSCKQDNVPCGPTRVVVSGGSGIGAAGNPVIDPATGGIIAVDVIAGGFAYASTPTAEVIDDCKLGSGATLRVVLGEAPSYEETFDDIEEYDLCEPGEFDNDDEEELYDSDGNLIGTWDPRSYFPDDIDPSELDDPIQKEIAEYQRLVTLGVKDPWWTTRTVRPGSITSGTQTFPQAYNVILPPKLRTDLAANNSPVWTDFMDTYAISPVPPSNVRGSDYAGRLFLMNWDVEFPYDGEYKFRGSCDNEAHLYIDQEQVFQFGKFFDVPKETFKFVKKGVHRVRIDLLNKEIYENFIIQPGGPIPVVNTKTNETTVVTTSNSELNLLCFGGGGDGGKAGNGVSSNSVAFGGIGLGDFNAISKSISQSNKSLLERQLASLNAGGIRSIINTGGSLNYSNYAGGGGAAYVASSRSSFRSADPRGAARSSGRSYVGLNGGGGGGISLDGNNIIPSDIINGKNNDGTGKNGVDFGGGGGSGARGYKGGNGGDGAVRLFVNGKVIDYTKPGRYEFVVPENLEEKGNKRKTQPLRIGIVCIGGGGSGYSDVEPTPEPFRSSTPSAGTGGGGGACFIVSSASVKYNSILEIVVGKGGIAPTNGKGGQRGGDSFVREKFVPNNEGANTRALAGDITAIQTPTSDIQVRKVFNTIDYIDKADRPLYRINPTPSDGDFIGKYGITPIKLDSPEAQDGSFAGTHQIRWSNVEFPVDGLYTVTIGVDDNVTLYIGNSATGGNTANSTGLIPIERGGDEIVIRKEGFRAPSKPNPISPTQVFVKAGRYRLRAELEQIPGKALAKGNPMALAIDIQVSYTEARVVSAKSWNENPMGVSLAITAPPPPIPQEIRPPQKGRCPNNPIWSTRDAGASAQWYPVEIAEDKGGNAYLNRYTMSPVPPLDVPNSDGSGVVWSNSWKVNIPFTGRYRLDGARADIARIKIDGRVVTGLTGVYTEAAQKWVEENFAGWEDPQTNTVNVGRKSTGVDLTEGEHEITVELVNIPQREVSYVDELIFSSIASINEATIPLYHYTYKGWSEFLNREGVTPCAPFTISIPVEPEEVDTNFTLLPPTVVAGGIAAFYYQSVDGSGDDVLLSTIYPFPFQEASVGIHASVKISGNISGSNAEVIRRIFRSVETPANNNGFDDVTLYRKGQIPGAQDYNGLNGFNVRLGSRNSLGLAFRFEGEPANIAERGTWEISDGGKPVPKRKGKYGNTVSYYVNGQRQFTMTVIASQNEEQRSGNKLLFDLKTGYPKQREIDARDNYLQEIKRLSNLKTEINLVKRRLNNPHPNSNVQQLNDELNRLKTRRTEEENRLVELGYAIRLQGR